MLQARPDSASPHRERSTQYAVRTRNLPAASIGTTESHGNRVRHASTRYLLLRTDMYHVLTTYYYCTTPCTNQHRGTDNALTMSEAPTQNKSRNTYLQYYTTPYIVIRSTRPRSHMNNTPKQDLLKSQDPTVQKGCPAHRHQSKAGAPPMCALIGS